MFGLIHGLYKMITQIPEYSLLFLGLDGAGKTSILNKIEQILYESGSLGDNKPRPAPIIPTVGQNSKLIVWTYIFHIFYFCSPSFRKQKKEIYDY